ERPFAGGAVLPDIGPAGEPGQGLRVEILVPHEIASIHEAPSDVPDRPLHLALGPCSVGPAGADAEAPVSGEAEELGILHQLAALVAQIPGDDAGHLVEEDLAGHPAEEGERFLQAGHQGRHILFRSKLEPEQARVAQYDDEGVALPPGEGEFGEVDLRLMAWLGFEADNRLDLRPRPDLRHVKPELGVT